jgi:hypothetical protein
MAIWLDRLQDKPRAKCFERIERLRMMGHELHRPYADTLRDGIHELRVRYQRVNYRMLYFFHGADAVILTHGLTKESEIPDKEIERALNLKNNFFADPESHTFYWEP